MICLLIKKWSLHLPLLLWLPGRADLKLQEPGTNYTKATERCKNRSTGWLQWSRKFWPLYSIFWTYRRRYIITRRIRAGNSFENMLIWGTSIKSDKPDQVKGFGYKEENNVYNFKVGIVPKKQSILAMAPRWRRGCNLNASSYDKLALIKFYKITHPDMNQWKWKTT